MKTTSTMACSRTRRISDKEGKHSLYTFAHGLVLHLLPCSMGTCRIHDAASRGATIGRMPI